VSLQLFLIFFCNSFFSWKWRKWLLILHYFCEVVFLQAWGTSGTIQKLFSFTQPFSKSLSTFSEHEPRVRPFLACIFQLSCLCSARPSWDKTELETSFMFKLIICLWMRRAKPHNSQKTETRCGDTSPFSRSVSFEGSPLGRLVAEKQSGLVLLVTGNEDFKKLSPSGGRVCASRPMYFGDFSFRRLKKKKLRIRVEE